MLHLAHEPHWQTVRQAIECRITAIQTQALSSLLADEETRRRLYIEHSTLTQVLTNPGAYCAPRTKESHGPSHTDPTGR